MRPQLASCAWLCLRAVALPPLAAIQRGQTSAVLWTLQTSRHGFFMAGEPRPILYQGEGQLFFFLAGGFPFFFFRGRPPMRPHFESSACVCLAAVVFPPLAAMQRGQTSNVKGWMSQYSSAFITKPHPFPALGSARVLTTSPGVFETASVPLPQLVVRN